MNSNSVEFHSHANIKLEWWKWKRKVCHSMKPKCMACNFTAGVSPKKGDFSLENQHQAKSRRSRNEKVSNWKEGKIVQAHRHLPKWSWNTSKQDWESEELENAVNVIQGFSNSNLVSISRLQRHWWTWSCRRVSNADKAYKKEWCAWCISSWLWLLSIW